MKKIEMEIECPACKGTGLYQGIGEGKGTAVVCRNCKGTGAYSYSYSYNEFTGRKHKDGIERVYLSGTSYQSGLGVINFSKGVGEIDMNKEGVSYSQFLSGDMPHHVKKLGCPMSLDQGACHNKKGFTNECNRLNDGWVGYIPDCKNQINKLQCWNRFEES